MSLGAALVALLAGADFVAPVGDDDAFGGARVVFAPRLSMWIGDFERGSDGCTPIEPFEPGPFEPERAAPEAFDPCAYADRTETGLGAGGEVTLRPFGPLFLSASVEAVYTFAGYPRKNQLFVPIGFRAYLSWPEWVVYPIGGGAITGMLYVTDNRRDFTLGGFGGFGVRIRGFGHLTMVGGFHTSDSMEGGQITIGWIPETW